VRLPLLPNVLNPGTLVMLLTFFENEKYSKKISEKIFKMEKKLNVENFSRFDNFRYAMHCV